MSVSWGKRYWFVCTNVWIWYSHSLDGNLCSKQLTSYDLLQTRYWPVKTWYWLSEWSLQKQNTNLLFKVYYYANLVVSTNLSKQDTGLCNQIRENMILVCVIKILACINLVTDLSRQSFQKRDYWRNSLRMSYFQQNSHLVDKILICSNLLKICM